MLRIDQKCIKIREDSMKLYRVANIKKGFGKAVIYWRTESQWHTIQASLALIWLLVLLPECFV